MQTVKEHILQRSALEAEHEEEWCMVLLTQLCEANTSEQ